MSNNNSNSLRHLQTGWATFSTTVVFLALMFFAAWYFSPGVNLACVVVLLFLFLMALSLFTTGSLFGFLVNDRNVMSLSRLQLAGWTAVILGSYFTYVLSRLFQGEPDPLRVQFDWHLWSLLGISTTSLVGSSLISGTKKDKEPDPAFVADASTATDDPDTDKNRQGTLYANPKPSDAQFTDLFQGDEIADTAYLDLAKVQMFFFTVVTLATYVVIAARELVRPLDPALGHLPDMPEGMIAILGISHAGYLGNKSVAHTPSPPR